MRRLFRAAAKAAAATAKAAVNVAYSDTMKAKAAQGATEISNALFSQSPAYSPVTAEKAADRIDRAANQTRVQSSAHTAGNAAHRAQYQAKDNSQALGH